MLVALPSAIAFGVTIYSPPRLGLRCRWRSRRDNRNVCSRSRRQRSRRNKTPDHDTVGPRNGCARRLCGGRAANGASPSRALLSMSAIALMCGALQVSFGLARIGRLIKYMPYPVVSGFSAGVGIMIVVSQVPIFGAPKHTQFMSALSPQRWS
jgi:sulfate permease, SulP family